MSFCTVINCMDGRVQLPVIQFLQQRFNVPYVDTITEAGPVAILANQNPEALLANIQQRVSISLNIHDSVGIAIVAHDQCAGNPQPPAEQHEQLHDALRFVEALHPDVEVIALWVDENWEVEEMQFSRFA